MAAIARNTVAILLVGLTAGCVSPAEPHNTRGVALFNSGQYDSARAEFLDAAAVDSVNPDAYYNLASTYHRLGNVAEAERNFVHCLALDPNHSKAHHAYTVLLLENNRTAEAYDLAQRWAAQMPGQPDPLVELAWLDRQAGRTEQARQLLHQVIATNPKHPRALTELASIYESSNESQRALALYQRALAADPNLPELSGRIADLRAAATTPGVDTGLARSEPPTAGASSRASRDLRFQLR